MDNDSYFFSMVYIWASLDGDVSDVKLKRKLEIISLVSTVIRYYCNGTTINMATSGICGST